MPNAAPQSRMRLFEHRVEHRRQIAGRGVDDLQYLGGRGLLLQRLALLGDQPRILHRDHRLRGEVLQQGDLLVGERTDLRADSADHAIQASVLAQRNREVRASAGLLDEHRNEIAAHEFRRCHVRDVQEPLALYQFRQVEGSRLTDECLQSVRHSHASPGPSSCSPS